MPNYWYIKHTAGVYNIVGHYTSLGFVLETQILGNKKHLR